MLCNGCWKILAVSSIDFESTEGWDVIDELADNFVEVKCARVQATLSSAEPMHAVKFQKHLGQDGVPHVQYRCKARYAKDAKDVVVLWSQNLTTLKIATFKYEGSRQSTLSQLRLEHRNF